MGASAGDLLARDVVCEWIRESGHEFDVATAPPFDSGIDWRSADSTSYSHIVFVCGPFGNGPPVDEFLAHFGQHKLIGVNLSMLQPLEEWNPFDLLLERDSSRTQRPDLVLLSRESPVPVVGLVLIDAQPEYASDKRESVDAIIREFVSSRPMALVDIDTRLDVNRTGLRSPAEIESLIARMDLVITTRLHGTVLAIKNGVPVIAIDAVAGGAKISRQVRALGWPVAFGAENVSVELLCGAFEFCCTPQARTVARRCAERGISLLGPLREEFLARLNRAGR
jgi:hypothetical protein